MSAQHTPGRLRYDCKPGYCGELLAQNNSICSFNNEPSKANARRLVACWNACTGLPTEKLEIAPVFDVAMEAKRHLESVETQRDDLLAALKHIEGVAMADECRDLPGIVKTARAAIQKAEGK